MRKEGGGSRNIVGRILGITGITLIVLVIALCSLLVLPEFLGFRMYHVLSGSMEPEIPVGSLLYVQGGQPEEVEAEDIIAFYSSVEDGGIITHRVMENNVVSGIFHTKGDANEKEDPMPVSYDNYIGSVVFSIPYMGEALTVMTSFYGKIAAMCVIVLGVILNLAGSAIGNRN